MKLRSTFLLILSVILVYSCSSSQEVVDTGDSGGIYPAWYSTNGFKSDSTAFSGFGIAIAADSSNVLYRATTEARKNLDLAIGGLTEDIRTQLVSEGISSASNTDFILILRNAHADAVAGARMSSHYVVQEEGRFRAFAEVIISKEELLNQLEIGFNGHPRYWSEFSTSQSFRSILN